MGEGPVRNLCWPEVPPPPGKAAAARRRCRDSATAAAGHRKETLLRSTIVAPAWLLAARRATKLAQTADVTRVSPFISSAALVPDLPS